MKKFIVLYHAPVAAEQNMQADPVEMKGVMDAWMDWGKRCGEGMVDMGTPLGNAHSLLKDGQKDSSSDVVGFSILQADSMDEVLKMLKGHPHLNMPGACTIEVHESLQLPM